MEKRRLFVALLVVALVAGAAIVFLLARGDDEGVLLAEQSTVAGATGAARRTESTPATEARGQGAGPQARHRPSSEEDRALARGFHEAVRDARMRSRGAPATPPDTPTPTPAPDDEARGSLDPQYIRDAVRELTPLIAECYDRALEQQADLQGNLVVEFTIEGAPDVGGVVEETTIADASTLRHPSLEECVRETMYTLRLPAPEGSGSVHVRYPFRFARTDDSAAGAGADGHAPADEH